MRVRQGVSCAYARLPERQRRPSGSAKNSLALGVKPGWERIDPAIHGPFLSDVRCTALHRPSPGLSPLESLFVSADGMSSAISTQAFPSFRCTESHKTKTLWQPYCDPPILTLDEVAQQCLSHKQGTLIPHCMALETHQRSGLLSD
ncbi:hypothetical protein LZ30DRAFT_247191 [Colletotrichum cereale]|nr:hypothetical protein LZ30DRAFT_247191 [Colletotrichum cereale]